MCLKSTFLQGFTCNWEPSLRNVYPLQGVRQVCITTYRLKLCLHWRFLSRDSVNEPDVAWFVSHEENTFPYTWISLSVVADFQSRSKTTVMAEIRIEKTKPVWPWILLALGLVALLLYLFVFNKNEKNENADTEPSAASVNLIDGREANSTVASYVTFVQADTSAMSLDHTYTNTAFLKLNDAINAMAGEVRFDVKADLDLAKQHADSITHNPFETTHADHIRAAADIFSMSLQNLQQAKYPSLAIEAASVKTAAAGINPEMLTLEQRDAVKNFFREAAGLLQKMNWFTN